MATRYPLHEDYKHWQFLNQGAVKINKPYIALAELGCRLSCLLFRTPQRIERSYWQFPGYEGAPISLTFFAPKNLPANAPCLIYYHGGGFYEQELLMQLQNACRYALHAGCKVAFVHYRLLPKYPFPYGVEDCYAALCFVHQQAKALGIDPNRIAVGGDSAGGTLSAVIAQMARDRNGPKLCFQMLIYPATKLEQDTQSIKDIQEALVFNAQMYKQLWPLYTANGDCGIPQYIVPMNGSDLSGLPTAYVETEEFDCLRDEGIAYAQAMRKAGVKVYLNTMKGTFHGYDVLIGTKPAAAVMQLRYRLLREAFCSVFGVTERQT